jgi:SAM-dependent methyltransferase
MNDEEFRLLDQLEEDHWWFAGKRLLLAALLGELPVGERFLDLGCGTGGVLREWSKAARCVGVDRSRLALRICAERGFAALARADLTSIPFRDGLFDTIVVLDVIEHLENDLAFLRATSALCAEGGRLLISVPAFQALWSQHDETFGHFRRYSARQLERVVRDAGLVPERITYTNSAVFPVAAAWRLASRHLGLGRLAPRHDFWPIPRWLNSLLLGIYRIEARALRRLDLPFGVSVACVARMPPRS